MKYSRQSSILAVLALSAMFLAACGAGSDSDSGTAASTGKAPTSPAVGTFDVTTEVTASNIEGKTNSVGDTEQMPVVLSCADDACKTLHLRAGAVRGPLSRAYLLTRADTGLTGGGSRQGPCTESTNPGEPGTFTETVTFDLQIEGTELTGTHEYRFTGCGFDAKASAKDVGSRTGDEAPYLAKDQVASVVSALTPYDNAVGTLYSGANTCTGKAGAAAATCWLDLVEPWAPTFDDLETALGGLKSAGPCERSLADTDLPALHAAVDAVVTGLQGTKTRAATYTDDVPALSTQLTEEHERLVTALSLCVDPSAIASLGDQGTVSMDINRQLPVMRSS